MAQQNHEKAGDLDVPSSRAEEDMQTESNHQDSEDTIQASNSQQHTVSGSNPPEDELEPKPEHERTLTDHLNKKLLESFLSRLDTGSMTFPDQTNSEQELEEDFED